MNLNALSTRELIAELAVLEDAARHAPVYVGHDADQRLNPELGQIILRELEIIRILRIRRQQSRARARSYPRLTSVPTGRAGHSA